MEITVNWLRHSPNSDTTYEEETTEVEMVDYTEVESSPSGLETLAVYHTDGSVTRFTEGEVVDRRE